MKSLLLFLCLAATTAAAPLDIQRFLNALAQVETGARWDGRPGPAGELSAWQIRKETWRQHTGAPFRLAATNAALAEVIAIEHITWLELELGRRGLPVTPAAVATCWNGGLGRAGQWSDFGQRVENLYRAAALAQK